MHAFKHAPHATQMMGNDGEKQVQNEQVTPSQDPQGLPEKKQTIKHQYPYVFGTFARDDLVALRAMLTA
jgi:hypothetical protein